MRSPAYHYLYTFELVNEGRVIDTVIAPDQELAAKKANFKYGDMATFIEVRRGKPFDLSNPHTNK